MRSRALLTLLGLTLWSLLLVDGGDAWARATSGGSRGSRSYSAPARPAPSPVAPANPTSPLGQPQPSRPGVLGGLMSGLAGFALGGLLASLLFGGPGGGIGLLEIVLIVGGALLLLRVLRTRQSPRAPAYAGASAYGGADPSAAGVLGAEASAAPSDLERGVGHIRQTDAGFDPAAFAQWAQRVFVDVQDAIMRRDLTAVADRLTPQEYARLQAQCDQLRAARQTNRVEQLRFQRVEVSEAWQEGGQDWATVYVAASLADYTVDEATGALVDGARTPRGIEEYWTFTRPVGPKPWRLSAIQTS